MENIKTPDGWLEPDVKRGEWIDAKKAGKPWPTPSQWAELRRLNAEKDAHRDECPMGQVGKISTLCACKELEKAEAEECLRCHQFVNGCKCGNKAQWI